MNKLILIIVILLSSLSLYSQNVVHIEVTKNTTSYCEITLYPENSEYAILSNVVFTLKWSGNIVLGTPLPNIISLAKSGPVLVDGKDRYQIFAGFGFSPITIEEPIVIRIPKSGNKGRIFIAFDSFITNIEYNGKYYVSIGGEEVTGDILLKKIEEETDSPVYMFYDPTSRQIIVKRNNEYINLIGQKIRVIDESILIPIRK